MASNDQLNWKVITDELKGGDLIPVVGPELLWITRKGRSESYRLWLAGELARELGILSEGLDGFLHPVEEVMLRFYKQGDIRSIRPYQVVKALIGEKEFPVPESLRKLAGIKKFRFFLTTIYEPFLETAVKEAWGIQDTQIRILENNLTKQPEDLTKFTLRSAQQQFDPRYIENLYKNSAPPSIYYLYGRPSRMKSYALAEDDVLEAILMLESSIYRPDELINFLSGKRLLILGCNFPNWLARFFISLTSPDPKNPAIQPVFVMSDESRFYRKEWDLAITLAGERDADDIPILPLQIGPISTDSGQIPEPFRRLQWIDAPAGKISDDGLFRISEIYQKTNR